MKENIKPCLELHLPDKARAGNVVPADAWFDAAEAHLSSARTILSPDPVGASIIAWSAMHKTAKGVASIGGCRIEAETHGKIVDFLVCIFPTLSNEEKGLVRSASTGRNAMSYDDPRMTNPDMCRNVIELASRMLAAARDQRDVKARPKQIPPPPQRS